MSHYGQGCRRYDCAKAERERVRAQRAVKDDLQAMAGDHQQAMAEMHASLYRPKPPMRRPLLVFATWILFALVVTAALIFMVIQREVWWSLLAVAAMAGATIWATGKWS